MKYFTIQELTRSDTAARLHIDNTPDRDQIRCLELLVNNILDPCAPDTDGLSTSRVATAAAASMTP